MGIYFFTIFFASLIFVPFAGFLYEGKRTPYKGSEFLCEISSVDVNTERILSILSNKLKEEGYTGIMFALLMLRSFFLFFLYALFKKERINQFNRNILRVRIHESAFDISNNGSLKKAIDTVKTLEIKNKRLVFNVEKKDEYFVFEMSVWGYVRLRFPNMIEKPFQTNKNAHRLKILLPAPGEELYLAGSEFRTIFSIRDTDYNKSAGIKRLLDNVKKDYLGEGIGNSFEYRLEGDNVVLSTIK